MYAQVTPPTRMTTARVLARQSAARWGALAFGLTGLGFAWLTLGRALTVGHLFLAVPLDVELAEAAWLWLAWTAWGAVLVARWANRQRPRLWWGAGAALGAGGAAVPTALVCTAACGGTAAVGFGALASVGTAMALAAWLPWLWGAVALFLTLLTFRWLAPPRGTAAPRTASAPRWDWDTREVAVLGVALMLVLGLFGGYVVGGGGR